MKGNTELTSFEHLCFRSAHRNQARAAWRTWRDLKAGNVTSPLQKSWIPNINVVITEDALVILVELAGLRRENLDLTADGNRLLISGVRPEQLESNSQSLVNEIHMGPFQCVIDVPAEYDLRGRETEARYQNGFLGIRVRRRQSSDQTLHASATLEPHPEGQVTKLVVSRHY